MSEVRVRRADPDQAALVAGLGRRYLERWSGSPAGFLTEEKIAADFARPGSHPDDDFWCVDVDGRVAAFAELIARAPFTELEVVLFTDPNLTGDEAGAVGEANLRRRSARPRGPPRSRPQKPRECWSFACGRENRWSTSSRRTASGTRGPTSR